ncbi:MAG: zf-HC2 domain-containing protein [Mariprofundus sp.]
MKHACNQASKLASDSLDRPLSLWERVKLKLHLSMCSNCEQCDSNLKFIHQVNALMRKTNYGQIQLTDEQRKRLHQSLDSEA